VNDATPASPEELRTRLERAVGQSPLGEVFADPETRRRKLFELMAATDDPMAKELGKDLLSGRLSLRTVATSAAYQDFLGQGLERLQEVSLADLVEQLETGAREEPATTDVDDDEDYSEGPVVFRRPDEPHR
jgi:hypothetical protein